MRKNDRDKIVELISSLDEAMDYCYNIDDDTVAALVEDCEAAITSILNILNSQLSDANHLQNKEVFHHLENAIQVFHDVKNNPVPKELFLNVKRDLSILGTIMDKEEVQYEIVFLPYNASMWDSLESIWMAAMEDPNCIPYVIPIPYYDKNSDGTFGQMHYDGELFPDYVPITNYLEYDIINRRPEMIYFHNPYDKYNKVTSVHPLFYSDKLKTYTDMLVYVPYFMVLDYLSEDFVILPGVIHANKVIVQSEEIAEEYQKLYPGQDKDKFLPLGSPKLDKVIKMSRLSREELRLPEEWKKRIGNKKVILYNTHLNHIMNHGSLLIKKLKYVFSCFENREDAILLWRPHPFSESTAVAMNPDFLEEYRQLEKEFKEKEIGIFDDTPELHRTLALADAYYGDWSSLVPMFGATGKPVMIQDINIVEKDDKENWKRLNFFGAFEDQNDLWFSNNDFNGLFKINIKSGISEFIASFPNEKKGQSLLYSEVYQYGNKLIFLPRSARSIVVFDIRYSDFKSYVLDNDIVDVQLIHKFLSAIRYKDTLFLLPAQGKAIIKFDMDKETVEYITGWYKEMEQYIMDGNEILFRQGAFIKDNIAWIPSCAGNVIMEFDMISYGTKFYQVGKSEYRYTDIVHDGKFSYLIPRIKAPIVKFKIQDGKVKECIEYNNYPENFEDNGLPFSFGQFFEDKLYVFPLNANMVLQLDTTTGKISEVEIYKKSIQTQKFYSRPWINHENEIRILAAIDGKVLMVNKLGEIMKSLQVSLPAEWDEYYRYNYIHQDEDYDKMPIEIEEKNNSLQRFLRSCNSANTKYSNGEKIKENSTKTANTNPIAGEQIHRYITKQFVLR